MRFAVSVAVLLLLLQGVVSPTTHAQDQTSGSIGGEIKFTTTPSGGDEVKINFQVGDAEELKSTDPVALEKISKDISNVNHAIHSNHPTLLYVVGENETRDLPQQIYQHNRVETIVVPNTLRDQFNQFWKTVYRAPSNDDIAIGIILGTVRATTTGLTWIKRGISVELAMIAAITYGGTTVLNNVFGQTLDNIFAYGLKERKSRIGKIYRAGMITLKNMLWDFALANGTYTLTGARNSYGQFAGTFASNATLATISSAQKNIMLQQHRHLGSTYSILLAPITYTIQAFDNAGDIDSNWTIGTYQLRWTVLSSFAIYSAMIATNTFLKQPVIKVLEVANSFLQPVISTITIQRRAIQNRICNLLLNLPGRVRENE